MKALKIILGVVAITLVYIYGYKPMPVYIDAIYQSNKITADYIEKYRSLVTDDEINGEKLEELRKEIKRTPSTTGIEMALIAENKKYGKLTDKQLLEYKNKKYSMIIDELKGKTPPYYYVLEAYIVLLIEKKYASQPFHKALAKELATNETQLSGITKALLWLKT